MADYVALTYDRIIHQTDGAILFDFGDLEQWIPISQIDPEYLPLPEEGGEVAVEYWFIKKEGLESYES